MSDLLPTMWLERGASEFSAEKVADSMGQVLGQKGSQCNAQQAFLFTAEVKPAMLPLEVYHEIHIPPA